MSKHGDLGSGVGHGGGGGGSIRSAGGSFGAMEVAHEEEYFYKQVNGNHISFQINIKKSEES